MRKKINGHIYDTNTAKEIARHEGSSIGGWAKCGLWKERYVLYRTRCGFQFVYYRYEDSDGMVWEKITPWEADYAKRWETLGDEVRARHKALERL